MSFLGFLKTAQVEEVVPKTGTSGAGGPRKQRNPNPTFLGIRLWADGSAYPSQVAVDKFNLEYGSGVYKTIPAVAAVGKEGEEGYVAAKSAVRKFEADETAIGNGFDVIDSQSWNQFKGEGRLLFLGVVPKNLPKVDLFGTTRYDAEGKPLTTVMEQGSATYGKDVLVPLVEEVYGIKFQRNAKDGVEAQEGVEFVDLEVISEAEGVNINEQFGRPIIFAPKRLIRGKDAGKEDYVRRENMPLYALVPSELLQEQQPVPETEEVEETADLSA